MDINTIQSNIPYSQRNEKISEQMQSLQPATEKTESTPQERYPLPQDEYISSENSEKKPTGLYQIGRDDNGNQQIIYDDPNKKKVQNPPANDSADKTEECTANTDKVDQEIEKLKEEKKKIEQQLKSTDDEKAKKQLENELTMIESELLQKDNDSYRKEHSTFS